MEGFQILLIVLGLFLVTGGYLNLDSSFTKKTIRLFSEFKGVRPQITKKTLLMAKIQGWFFIFIGLATILFGLLFCSLFPIACQI